MCAQSLGSLYVELSANTAAFVDGMTKASYTAKTAGKDIESAFSNLGDLVERVLAPLGPFASEFGNALNTMGQYARSGATELGKMGSAMTIVGAAGGVAVGAIGVLDTAFVALALHTAESIARMGEQAQSAGVTVEALSGLSYIAQEAGVSQDTLVKSLEKMSKAALAAADAPATASNAFTKLGVAVKDADGTIRPAEDIFADLAGKFAAMPDGVEKTALAIAVFGKGGAAMIPVVNQGTEAIKEQLTALQKLGAIMDDATANSAEKFKASLVLISAAGDGLANQLTADLLPAFQTVATGIVNFAIENADNFATVISAIASVIKWTIAIGDEFGYMVTAAGGYLNILNHYVYDVGQTIYDVLKAGLDPFSDGTVEDAWNKGTSKIASDAALNFNAILQNQNDHSGTLQNLFNPRAPFTLPPKKPQPDLDQLAALKAHQTAVEALTNSYKLQIDSIGLDAVQIQQLKLVQEGWTAAERAGNLALQEELITRQNIFQASSKMKPPTAPTKPGDNSSDLQDQADAIEASIRAAYVPSFDLNNLWEQMGATGPTAFRQVDVEAAALTKQLQTQIDTFGKSQTQIQIMALAQNGAMSGDIALAQSLDSQLTKLDTSGQKLSSTFKKFGDQVATDFADMIVSGKSFVTVLEDILKQVIELLAKQALLGDGSKGGGLFGSIVSFVGDLFGGGVGSVASASGGAIDMGSGLPPFTVPFLATGGSLDAGQTSIIGENGPELFVPDTAGSVVPNGAGTTVVNNYSIDARGAQPGVERDIMRALKATEDRAVVRSIAMQQQIGLRTPSGG